MLNQFFFFNSVPNITTSGGVEIGGSADVSTSNVYNEITSGGVIVKGSARTTNIVNSYIVPTLDDEDDFNVIYNQITSGGVEIGGSADVSTSHSYTTSGGVIVDGSASQTYNEITSGGVIVDGSASQTYNEITNGGVIVSGEVEVTTINSSNGVIVNGSAEVTTISNTSTTDGVTVGGSATVSVTINYVKVFTWDINTGISYWWRVESDCVSLECPPISIIDTCANTPNYMSLTYIMATDCNDLINKLTERNWTWPIKSIKRHLLPIFKSDIPPDVDISCNPLLDVDFSTCVYDPTLLVQENIEFTADLDMEISVNAESTNLYNFVSSGSINLTGDNEFNYIDTEIINFSADLGMEIVEISITNTTDTNFIETDTSSVLLGCCLLPIPRTLYLKHNLQLANNLQQFTKYNKIKLPDLIPMYYSTKTKIWQGNLNYKGNSYRDNTIQKWNLLFEFGWVKKVGPTDLSGGVWKFVMYIVDHKVESIDYPSTQNSKFTTYFNNNLFATTSPVGFSFTYNTQNGKLVPKNIVDLNFSDNIGLFDSKYWINNPLLSFSIQKGISSITDKFVKYPEIMIPINRVHAGAV